MTPSELSEELRNGDNEDLQNRRAIVGLSFAGCAIAMLVSAYQIGMIKRLPDPPLPLIDSNKVDASDYAYKRLQTPDGFLMLVNIALTAWTAAAGGKDRARTNPSLSLLMAAKTWVDLIGTIQLAREEYADNKAFCFYCQIATVGSLASALLSVGEARRAWKNLRG